MSAPTGARPASGPVPPVADLRPERSPRRRRAQGLVLLAAMLAVVGLCLASYAQVFTATDTVTLQADTAGNQLAERGDVTVRGIVVGEIRQITSDGHRASIRLAMDPSILPRIPSNVTAMLVPTTLLGRRAVTLQVPADPSPLPLRDGDVIGQDRSRNAIETEQVLDNLMPVLSAVQPEKLSDTLGTISQALDGRGKQLGSTLVQLNQYLEGVNPTLPDLGAAARSLSDTADAYDRASPDLLAALDDLAATSRTVVAQRAAFESTFRAVTQASTTATGAVTADRDTGVAVIASARPTLGLLARYSSEFPCLLQQLTDLTPRLNQVFRPDTGIQIAAEPTLGRGRYGPGDAPQYRDQRGPRCYRIAGQAPQYPPGGPLLDGSAAPGATVDPAADQRSRTTPAAPVTTPAVAPAAAATPITAPAPTVPSSAGHRVDAANIGLPDTPNSPEERRLVTEVTGLQMGVAPSAVPSFAPYLTGATMRGAPVSVR